MKITNIEQQGDVFILTKSPSLIQKIFGKKEKKEKFKDTGQVYERFPHIRAYVNEDGKTLSCIADEVKSIEDFRAKKQYWS
jgi:ABC-type branched-subunit amino acid transport system ATPase component